MKTELIKRYLLSGRLGYCLAFVFLPPQKEVEDWSGRLPSKTISQSAIQELSPQLSSDTRNQKLPNSRGPQSPFQYDRVTKIQFYPQGSSKAAWETSLPPIEGYKVWSSGAWTGLSLSAREIHHFYTQHHRRGREPKYRAYTLNKRWEAIDLNFCSPKDLILLERATGSNAGSVQYYLTKIKLLSSQVLLREAAWDLTLNAGQEILLVKGDGECKQLELEGWPKSYRVGI